MQSVVEFLPFLVWTLATASLLLTSILGVVIAFHWLRYAFAPVMTVLTIVVYAIVSLIFLSGMFAALAILNISI